MCYDCGCGVLDDDHGDPDHHITNATLENIALKNDTTVEDVKQNMLEGLEKSMHIDHEVDDSEEKPMDKDVDEEADDFDDDEDL